MNYHFLISIANTKQRAIWKTRCPVLPSGIFGQYVTVIEAKKILQVDSTNLIREGLNILKDTECS